MMQKFLAGILTLSCLSPLAKAQDKIYLRSGEIVEAKVKEVDQRVVVYKKYNNQDGPDYKLGKGEIEYIRYENGSEDNFSRRNDAPAPRRERGVARRDQEKYGRNILALAPIQMTNESAAGIGLHYERQVDPKGIISLYLPLAVSFVRNDYYYNGGTSDETSGFFYAYPGVKIYPTGSRRRISYGVGPSVALGFGNRYKSVDVYNPVSQTFRTERRKEEVFKSGLMVNNSLNIQPTKNFYLGVELGLGFTYFDNSDSYYYSDEPLVQFNFKLGYRF